MSTFEDKVVQDALREVLEAIYEQDFLDCSHGFRPGRRAHYAVRTLDGIVHRNQVNWVIEADIVSFFDSLDRAQLKRMLEIRVADGSLLRLIGKCLHVGVLDGVELSTPDTGATQGSVLSPLLGNIYLHYVLDLWFEREVKPRLRGGSTLIRYADDFIITFEREEDARRVREVLGKRLEKSGLSLHPDKTRLLPFRRPPDRQQSGRVHFLGFTFHWGRSRKGRWIMKCKTKRTSLRRTLTSIYAWCRRHRHLSIETQHAALCRRVQGHFTYFAVSGNFRSLQLVAEGAKWAWYESLRLRSQRTRLTGERFDDLLRQHPLPTPQITIQIWGPPP